MQVRRLWIVASVAALGAMGIAMERLAAQVPGGARIETRRIEPSRVITLLAPEFIDVAPRGGSVRAGADNAVQQSALREPVKRGPVGDAEKATRLAAPAPERARESEPTKTPALPVRRRVEASAEIPPLSPASYESSHAPSAGEQTSDDSGATPAVAPGDLPADKSVFDWSKYPETIHPMPRPGIFSIPPTQGPAYFSLWDELTDQCRPAPPKSGYAPFCINAWPFFDADWRYVDAIPPEDRTLVEDLKRIPLGDCFLFSTGGEFWARYHHEQNSRLTEAENDFLLSHVRLYGDLWYSDWLRIYGEYVWADSFGEELTPLPPDVDRGDILDLFADVKVFDWLDHPVYVRLGRQELLYGSQRLVTPLPWANKRHSFDGVKLFRRGEKWDFDAFWTQYVPPKASEFDTPDENTDFAGAWLTYRPKKGEAVDFYYLLYNNDNSAVQQGIVRSPFHTHTFGSRWSGDNEGWLWDFEGALQFGEQGGDDLIAGMATAGLGRSWKDACLTPTVWLYYDFASGDNNPNAGNAHTFNQQFPFGHYYMGWMDLVARQNIHDVNAHLYLYPTPWLTTWLQYHHFWLAESRDALYNAGGAAYRRDPTGAAGNNVGDEIDLVLNFHLTDYSDLLLSYNKLFGGGFLEATSGANRAEDAEALYLCFQQRW